MAKRRVFISYARKDMPYLERVRTDLQAANIAVWIDHVGLQVGTPDWEDTIRLALQEADAVLLLASPNSRDSDFVRDEIAVATNNNKPVLPLWIHGEHWNDAIPLGRGMIQYADVRGDQYAQGIRGVIKTILSLPQTVPDSEVKARFVTESPQTGTAIPIPTGVSLQKAPAPQSVPPTKTVNIPTFTIPRPAVTSAAIIAALIIIALILSFQPQNTPNTTAQVATNTAQSATTAPTNTPAPRPTNSAIRYNAPVTIPDGWNTYTVNELTFSLPDELVDTDPSIGVEFFNNLLQTGNAPPEILAGVNTFSERVEFYGANFLIFRALLVLREDLQIPFVLNETLFANRLRDVFDGMRVSTESISRVETPLGTMFLYELNLSLNTMDVRSRLYAIQDGSIFHTIVFSYREPDAQAFEPLIDQILQTLQISNQPLAAATDSP